VAGAALSNGVSVSGLRKRIASELKTPFFGFIQRISIQNLSNLLFAVV